MAKDNKKIPLREKKKRKTEHCITHSALLLFEEHGYDSVSIDDIAEASEVSKSTFYNYFDSKESVLLKLSVNSVNNVREEMAKLPDQDDPVFMIKSSFHFLIDDIYDWRNVARESAMISVYNAAAHDVISDLIVDYVDCAQQKGLFRTDYDCRTITRSFMGGYYIAIFGLDPDISKQECKNQLDIAFSILLEGVLQNKSNPKKDPD
jgi:Transcriptional regulator